MPKIPEIKGSKFILRELNPEKDKESLWKNINHPEIINKLTLNYPYTEKQWEGFVDWHKKMEKDEVSDINWMIYVNDECVGSISIMMKTKECQKHIGALGYWVAKQHWGKGIVSEAVQLVCDYAFNELGLLKLKIGFQSDNLGSRRVAEKNGFKVEYKKVKETFRDGEYKDLVYTTKFNDNFNV